MLRAVLIAVFFSVTIQAAVKLKIQGSTTVNPVVVEAAEFFRKTQGWTVLVDTQGGSGGGISALGDGRVDIAMSSKPVSDGERSHYPKINFVEQVIGYDGVALIVSRPIYDAGVKALSKEQIRSIYEGKIKNWKALGGPDKPVVFFNKEPGRGTWEVFAHYLYGKTELAPPVDHPEVGANEEARSKVGGHGSAISQLSAGWIEGSEKIRGLGLSENGKTIDPTLANIRAGTYPMRRALNLVTRGPATGPAKELIAYLKTNEGGEILKRHGYLPVEPLP